MSNYGVINEQGFIPFDKKNNNTYNEAICPSPNGPGFQPLNEKKNKKKDDEIGD